MATLLAIHGTVTRPGRLHQALQAALEGVEGHPGVSTSLLDLGQYRVSFADGRPLTGYSDDTQAVVEQVTAADMYLIGTPIYRASFTAALKNILDLTPVDGLMGKPCGLVGMGATDHHYLALDAQLRPVLAWFGARVLAVPVYLQSRHFRMANCPTLRRWKTFSPGPGGSRLPARRNRPLRDRRRWQPVTDCRPSSLYAGAPCSTGSRPLSPGLRSLIDSTRMAATASRTMLDQMATS